MKICINVWKNIQIYYKYLEMYSSSSSSSSSSSIKSFWKPVAAMLIPYNWPHQDLEDIVPTCRQ